MTPYQVSSEIYGGFFYSGIILNNGSLSKDAPYLNALSKRNFKFQLDSRYFTPIYKVNTGSVKKKVRLLFPAVPLFEASLAYLKIDLHFIGNMFPSEKAGLFPIFELRKIVESEM